MGENISSDSTVATEAGAFSKLFGKEGASVVTLAGCAKAGGNEPETLAGLEKAEDVCTRKGSTDVADAAKVTGDDCIED